jgi:hypothetical protein
MDLSHDPYTQRFYTARVQATYARQLGPVARGGAVPVGLGACAAVAVGRLCVGTVAHASHTPAIVLM